MNKNHKNYKVLSRLYLMQFITRCNDFPMKDRQNIAEHSWGVTALCVFIGNEITSKLRRLSIPFHLDLNFTIIMSLFHDYEETVTTDIGFHLKRRLGKDIMSAIDKVSQEEVQEDFENMGISFQKMKDAKEQFSEEYQLLKVCDYVELLLWTYNNRSKFSDTDYNSVVKNCKNLISTYPIHKHSSTVLELLESEEFEFSFQ